MAAVPQVANISLRNILFLTDFSPASETALPFALALARLYKARLEMAHVLTPEPHRQVTLDRLPAQDDREWEEARDKLDWLTHDPAMNDVAVTALVESGDLGEVIPALIGEHDVDIVVVGTRGRTGITKIVMGSGAEKIYQSAGCPVMSVGPEVRGAEWAPRRILCPIDLDRIHGPALRYASSLAKDANAVFIAMAAVPMVPWQHRGDVEVETCSRLQDLLSDHPEAQLLVRWEHPAEAILRAAADREADLIVMGVRKSRAAGFSSHLPWPVASEVVSRALCPVLTVRR